ncbi:MAG: hypothetical protein GQ559_12130 [Desulfobulbaceae bacterium]|nr:hypothetical protein [Desulfobulbaceae bacterium]
MVGYTGNLRFPLDFTYHRCPLFIEALAQWCVEQGKNDKEIELIAEMLVRAYDPCISCSVH